MFLCCQFVSILHVGRCKFRSVVFTLLLEGKQIFLANIDLLNKCMFTTHGLTQLLHQPLTIYKIYKIYTLKH